MSKSPNSVLNAGKKPRVKRRNAKYIRQNRGTSVGAKADEARVKKYLPYGL